MVSVPLMVMVSLPLLRPTITNCPFRDWEKERTTRLVSLTWLCQCVWHQASQIWRVEQIDNTAFLASSFVDGTYSSIGLPSSGCQKTQSLGGTLPWPFRLACWKTQSKPSQKYKTVALSPQLAQHIANTSHFSYPIRSVLNCEGCWWFFCHLGFVAILGVRSQ